jgi:nitrate/nitrite transport system substrate-binding protein
MAQEKGPLEKKDLKIGFIPITCASPLLMADPLGFYKAGPQRADDQDRRLGADPRQGAEPRIRRLAHAGADADGDEHGRRLQPHPAQRRRPSRTPTARRSRCTSSTRTSAIPKQWKGFKFAVPFEYSMHNFLLRYYVAEHGLDPDKDIQIRSCRRRKWSPTCAPATSTATSAPDPFNQRAVYDERRLHPHADEGNLGRPPCCSFGVPTDFVKQNPNTFKRPLYRAILTAAKMASDPKNRKPIMAEVLSPALPQPAEDRARTGAHRQVRRRPGQRAERADRVPTSSPSRGNRWRCGSSAR